MTSRTLRPPPLVSIAAALAVLVIAVPLLGLLQQTPWSTLTTRLAGPESLTALRVSLIVSTVSATVAAVLGFPLAWILARYDSRAHQIVRAIILVPMVLPPVVGGTALLFALGRRGLFGRWLDTAFGVALPFTTAGAIVAATFVALPFFVITVEAALRQQGTEIEEVAAVHGASPLSTLWSVTIPAARPAIIAGTVLAWARALGEFGATITFAGNLAGETRTLPLEIFLALESDPDTAIALSVAMLAISVSVLVALRSRWFFRG